MSAPDTYEGRNACANARARIFVDREWENVVKSELGHTVYEHTERLRVPGGWLYRVYWHEAVSVSWCQTQRPTT